ncbi:MAG: aromatic amino acid DMT transporter YddG [Candidatus Riflebacteria bacterium]|nr:aromatic amino acid DMT transporter YddG [Candidatus Riflebacteria bacterium]
MSDRVLATALGALSILIWASTIAVSRELTEQLGTLPAAAAIYVTGGVLACGHLLVSPSRRSGLASLRSAYWAGCGSLFVLYTVTFYLAIGLARGRQQVVEVGLVNYLWPSLTQVLSVPILGARPRWSLWPGIAISMAGVVLATFQGGSPGLAAVLENLRSNGLAHLLALVAAVSWGLYNTLSRRLAGEAKGNAVPVFILASGVVLVGLCAWQGAAPRWKPQLVRELVYMAVFPTFLAYDFWDTAMRRGHLVLVASLSYLTPLLSTIISCLYLEVPLGTALWGACALVIAGAALCSRSVEVRPGGS